MKPLAAYDQRIAELLKEADRMKQPDLYRISRGQGLHRYVRFFRGVRAKREVRRWLDEHPEADTYTVSKWGRSGWETIE